MRKKLFALLKGVEGIKYIPSHFKENDDLFIKGIETDSRKVQEGFLFVALDGVHRRGVEFVGEAIEEKNAAAALVPQAAVDALKNFSQRITDRCIVVEKIEPALAIVSKNFYGNPTSGIMLAGVTGTNGKTTFTYIMESIFRAYFENNEKDDADNKVGVIGTINYRYGGNVFPSVNTTPFAHQLMKIFYDMKHSGVKAVAMEVSSHSLSQSRVDGCEFDVCVFTNLTQDHLDYHRTMENYFEAKKRLFTELLEKSAKKNKSHIVNFDDEWGRKLALDEKIRSSRLITFSADSSQKNCDVRLISCQMSPRGMDFVCEAFGERYEFKTSLIGRYNLSNLLAAVATAFSLGIKYPAIKKGVRLARRIPGRLETIHSKDGFTVVVDYAHTPDALEKVIGAIKELNPSRLITVFGCGGDRDRTKRPIMGDIAVSNSDYVIVTSDNPRSEDPHKILLDVEIGIKKTGRENYTLIDDRRKAIETAINIASDGDIILLAGKGHEDYQIIGEEKIHFSDSEEAKKFIKARYKR